MLRVKPATASDKLTGVNEIIVELNAPVEGAHLGQENMSYLLSLRDADLL